MTKAELIEAVATAADVSKAEAERTLGAFFDTVTKTVKKGDDKVAWPGFGSFSTSKSAARTGRNPQTGAAVKIAASTRMKFTSSSTLKASLNPKKKPAATKAAATKAAPTKSVATKAVAAKPAAAKKK